MSRPALLLIAALAVALVPAAPARAAVSTCDGDQRKACVLLVEVDGLEPEDVSATRTPFLWRLAHPGAAAGPSDPGAPAGGPLLPGRRGFLWAAARAGMIADTASGAASLLTGSTAPGHGVAADEFRFGGQPTWLDATPPAAEGSGPEPIVGLARPTLLEAFAAAWPQEYVAAFVSNPGVARALFGVRELLVDGQPARGDLPPRSLSWWPVRPQDGAPQLCPLPRSAAAPPADQVCPAGDAQTLQQALSQLRTAGTQTNPALTYVHLAELGLTRRRSGTGSPASEAALARLDSALEAFVGGYSQAAPTSELWPKTALMIVGNHGYEETPPDRRVPDPSAAPGTPGSDLASYVRGATGGAATLVPQGTLGTVYYPRASAGQLDALARDMADQGNGACVLAAGTPCIAEVLAVRRLPGSLLPTVAERHPSWQLAAAGAERADSAGELLVVLEPGWALGRAAADPSAPADSERAEVTNPYPAAAGGPRNRAIAALVHGPAGLVRQTIGPDAPVTEGPDRSCSSAVRALPPPSGVAAPNADPADDANAPGHECQAETVDVAPTLAAILRVPLPAENIAPDARLLLEAFDPLLEGLGEEPPEPEPEPEPEEEPPPPPAPAPEIVVEAEPEPDPPLRAAAIDPFGYHGLVRELRARVVDAKGRPWRTAPPGARMDWIELRADFGRPSAQVTLTFYRAPLAARRGTARRGTRGPARRGAARNGARGSARRKPVRARPRLVAFARFKPFAVGRGPARLRLRVPPGYRPGHIGVAVVDLARPGRRGSGVVSVLDARRLHQVKPRAPAGPGRRRP